MLNPDTETVLTAACSCGDHAACPDVDANCCECSCHLDLPEPDHDDTVHFCPEFDAERELIREDCEA